MKLIFLISTLLSIAEAAPAIITRIHTAEPVTVLKTYTHIVTTVNVHTVNGTPAAPVPTTSTTPVAEPVATSPAEEPVPTSTAPAPPAEEPTSTILTTSTIPDETPSPETAVAPTTSTTPEAPTPEAPTPEAPTPEAPTPEVPTTSSTPQAPTTTSTTPQAPTTSTSTTSTAPIPTTSSTFTPSTLTTATSSAAPSPSSSLNSFESEILKTHNEKRALHGVQSLKWNPTLAQYAADYAAKSFSCDNVQLIHSKGPYGENLAAGYVGGADPVTAWYDEIKLYNYNSPGFSEATGHFTQVVWKSTSEVGCAKVVCNNEWRQYTICEYDKQRGNIVGNDYQTGKSYFAENVVPAL